MMPDQKYVALRKDLGEHVGTSTYEEISTKMMEDIRDIVDSGTMKQISCLYYQ